MRRDHEKLPKDIIRSYILENLHVPDIEDDCDIFASGMANSLFAIELMTFLESTFNIKVTMDDLDIENFKTVEATSRFVQRKKEVNHV